jgi:hypothetical protein
VGPPGTGGPRLGLTARFLIHTKEVSAFRNLPRLAVDEGDGGEMERRPLGRTRVHSLAMIMCSTNVDGANTGSLTPCQLCFKGCDGGGFAGEGSGDATSHDVLSSTLSHSRAKEAWEVFLRHCLNPLDSAEELRDRLGEGETGVKEKGDVPWGSPEIKDGRSSPARSCSGEEISQNCRGSRPNVSPHIPHKH